jgi:hypothetical protein
MADAVSCSRRVEAFYSYAHRDEPLCKEWPKRLTALNAGLLATPPSFILKTAEDAPPDEFSSSSASVYSKGTCHPMGELRRS